MILIPIIIRINLPEKNTYFEVFYSGQELGSGSQILVRTRITLKYVL